MLGFDKIGDCTKCESDACYKKDVSKEVRIEWCLGCGFTTNTLLKPGEKYWEEQIEVMPELNKALMVEEVGKNKFWMPSFTHVKEKGMVFANGTRPDNWKWGAVKSVPMSKEEADKIKSKEEWKADYSTLKEFEEKDFMEALDYIGIFEKE